MANQQSTTQATATNEYLTMLIFRKVVSRQMRIAEMTGRQTERNRQRGHDIEQHKVFIPRGCGRHRVLAAKHTEWKCQG